MTKNPVYLAILVLVITHVAQQQSQAQDQRNGLPFIPANNWMTIPVTWIPTADAVPTAIRQMRDDYFDELIGFSSPLTPDNAATHHIAEGSFAGVQPEFPVVPLRIILIGKFVSYQPVLSASHRAVYTEVLFQVTNQFLNSTGSEVGNFITLVIPGGTVKTQTGAVIPYLTDARHYSLKPGKTYLLVAGLKKGDFYMLAKSWDLSDGIVKPNFPASQASASTLVGLTYPKLLDTLSAEFSPSGTK